MGATLKVRSVCDCRSVCVCQCVCVQSETKVAGKSETPTKDLAKNLDKPLGQSPHIKIVTTTTTITTTAAKTAQNFTKNRLWWPSLPSIWVCIVCILCVDFVLSLHSPSSLAVHKGGKNNNSSRVSHTHLWLNLMVIKWNEAFACAKFFFFAVVVFL